MSGSSPLGEKGHLADNEMERYVDSKLQVEHVEPHSNCGQSITDRNMSVATNGGPRYSTGGQRRMSQWEG